QDHVPAYVGTRAVPPGNAGQARIHPHERSQGRTYHPLPRTAASVAPVSDARRRYHGRAPEPLPATPPTRTTSSWRDLTQSNEKGTQRQRGHRVTRLDQCASHWAAYLY